MKSISSSHSCPLVVFLSSASSVGSTISCPKILYCGNCVPTAVVIKSAGLFVFIAFILTAIGVFSPDLLLAAISPFGVNHLLTVYSKVVPLFASAGSSQGSVDNIWYPFNAGFFYISTPVPVVPSGVGT